MFARLLSTEMAKCEREDVATLVSAAQRGDGAALEALAVRFRSTAVLIARGVLRDGDLAEDAAQDALLTAFRALDNLQEPSLFGPWLATIVRNRARRLGQDGNRRRGVPLHVADRELLSQAPSLTTRLPERGEQAVNELPEGIRETMRLYYFEGWSTGEIAALLERPLTTVKWQLHAGRALLRKRLGEPES